MSRTPSPTFWDPPSDEVTTLIRRAVEEFMRDPGEAVAAVEHASLAANVDLIAMDDRFADAVRAASRANANQWVTANLRAPGMPVPANLGPENLGLARDVVRHGLDDTILMGFRAGQNAWLQYWTDLAFALTSDLGELHELLAVITRSVHAYVDDTLAALGDVIQQERDQLTNTTHAGRLEVIELILQGAPISQERASRRLDYDLSRFHVAAVVWTDLAAPEQMERVTQRLARAVGSSRPLTVPISESTWWVWASSRQRLDVSAIRDALPAEGPVRVALGAPAPSMAGFRRSHLEAVAAQRLARRFPEPAHVTTYEDIEVAALATIDEERAREFVTRTLGELTKAPSDLRATLRAYLREQSSATRTATAMYTHRNTVMARVERAVQLLPHGLEGRTLNVQLALEIVHHWGPEAGG